MSREEGTFPISANFEPKIASTLDARGIVDDFADLLLFTAANFIRNGFVVSVEGASNPNEKGIYQCIDKANLNNPASWNKIGVSVVEYNTSTSFPTPGEVGVVYIAIDTNFIYRWSGSDYVGLGTVHQVSNNNPHSVTKSQVGLANVDNTSDANKPISNATQTALSGKAASLHSHLEGDISDISTSFITSDTVLPDSNSFTGTITIKNVSNAALFINTLALDKFEGANSQIIYPNESFTIKLYQINDYRII